MSPRLFRHVLLLFFSVFNILITQAQKGMQPIQDLQFVENKGQLHPDYLFKADIPDGKLYFSKNFLGFIFYDGAYLSEMQFNRHFGGSQQKKNLSQPSHSINCHAIKMTFINANNNLVITPENPLHGITNFIIGNDPKNWHTNIHSYRSLNYHNLYDGIDLHINEHKTSIKYEYHIAPGSDYKNIQVRIDGAHKLKIENEHLVIGTSLNHIVDEPPIAWQIVNGRKKHLACSYGLKKNKLFFKFKEQPLSDRELIIDPQLIFSTSSGSTADNWGNTACLDEQGNLYTGGTVYGLTGNRNTPVTDLTGFPTTPGAFQTSFQSISIQTTDMAIMKFDSSGTNLIYSTYLGGNETDVPISTVAAPDGTLYVLGATSSDNFPGAMNSFSGGSSITAAGAIDFNNGSDLVITALSPFGNAVLASRYIGGTENDGVLERTNPLTFNYGDPLRGDILLDENGDVYCASMTESNDFPVFGGPQTVFGGGNTDAVGFKLTQDLTTILWSSYFGGTGSDAAYSIQVTSDQSTLIAGGTTSNDFPTNDTVSSYQGGVDGFLSKIDATGSLLLGTVLTGTSENDQTYFVQIDDTDSPHILGQTFGIIPVNNALYFNERSGHYIQKYLPDLSAQEWSTVFGQSASDSLSVNPNISPTAFLVNECGNMFISGWGGSINSPSSVDGPYYEGSTSIAGMPITAGAYKTITDGNDFYLLALLQNAQDIIYGTYFGGAGSFDHVDGGTSRFDKKGIVYQSVCAGCGGQSDWPVFPDDGDQSTFPKTNGSLNCNNGVFKFDLSQLNAALEIDQETCFNKNITFINNSVGGVDFQWDFGDFTGEFTSTPDTVEHTYLEAGTYTVTLTATDLATCTGVDVATGIVTIIDSVYATGDTLVCPYTDVSIYAAGPDNPLWDPNPSLSCTNCSSPNVYALDSTWYFVRSIGPNGCQNIDSVLVDVYPNEKGFTQIIADIPRCFDETVNFQGGIYENDCICCKNVSSWEWDFGDGTTSTENSPSHIYNAPGTYQVILTTVTNTLLFDTLEIRLNPLDSCFKNIYIPNAFTPNNDGTNDTLFVRAVNLIELDFHLYNRTGEEVFQTNSLKKGWDGYYKGKKMTEQVFVYTCNATFWDGSTFSQEGNVTLIE